VVAERANGRYIVSPKFDTVRRLFEAETEIELRDGPYGPFCYLSDEDEIETALEWQDEFEDLIFLRDNLDFSIAVDFNFASAGVYTEVGQAEHDAKTSRSANAIRTLSSKCIQTIRRVPFYSDSSMICAVPPSPNKEWDLPTEIVGRIAEKTGQTDISDRVVFTQEKESVKSLTLAQKWAALQAGGLEVQRNVKGRKIVLVDDKYQSGTTAQFIASKLYEAGAAEVNGLFCVKTWRDTDNR